MRMERDSTLILRGAIRLGAYEKCQGFVTGKNGLVDHVGDTPLLITNYHVTSCGTKLC